MLRQIENPSQAHKASHPCPAFSLWFLGVYRQSERPSTNLHVRFFLTSKKPFNYTEEAELPKRLRQRHYYYSHRMSIKIVTITTKLWRRAVSMWANETILD